MTSGPLQHVPAYLQALALYTPKTNHPPIRLDANESPFPIPSSLAAELGAVATNTLHRYPDGSARELKESLAIYLRGMSDSTPIEPNRLLLGVGSDEIIAMIVAAFAGDGIASRVLFPAPTFVMYAKTAIAHGLTPVEIPLATDFAYDDTAIANAIREHEPAVVFYATPNNPTGRTMRPPVLRTLIESFPNTLHLIDEAYGPFERPHRTHLSWTDRYANVAVMGTLSKVGFAGLRVGYIYAPVPLLEPLERVRQPYNLSTPVQAMATHLLRHHTAFIRTRTEDIVKERTRLFAAFSEQGLAPIPSQANFQLVRLSAERAASLRANHGISVRVFGDPRLDGYARITVGTPSENDALLNVLADS